MALFLALLMILALWLVCRPKRLTTQQIIEKYQARQRKRNEKYQVRMIPRDNTIPTEQQKEVLREEYARQKDFAERIARAEIDARGYRGD
jgi:hypothetical protein